MGILLLPFLDCAHQHFLLVGAGCADLLREWTIEGFAGFHPGGLVAHQANPALFFRLVGCTTVVEAAVEEHCLTWFGQYALFLGKTRVALGGAKKCAVAAGNDDDRTIVIIQLI